MGPCDTNLSFIKTARNYAHWEILIAQVSITVITVLPFGSGAWVSFPKTLDAARDLGLNGAEPNKEESGCGWGHEHPWEAHPSPQVRHSLAAYFPCKNGIIPKGTTYITVGYETCCRVFLYYVKWKLPAYYKSNFSYCWLIENSLWFDFEGDLQLAFLYFKAILFF